MVNTLPRPLAGYAVGITGHRRWEEQAEMLARRGARVVYGPTMATTLLGDLAATVGATERVLADRVDTVVLTTGIGTRSWFAAAESAGIDDELRRALSTAHIVARGPKTHHAARAVDLDVAWTAASETNREVVDRLAGEGLAGQRVVVQRDGGAPLVAAELATLGVSEVVDVPVYQWRLPDNRDAAVRLLESAARRDLDAVTFTCAYAVHNAFELCTDHDELVGAFDDDVLAVAVGPVTAQALRANGVRRVVEPVAARLGSMVRALVAELAGRGRRLRYRQVERVWQGIALIDPEGVETELTKSEAQLLARLVSRAPAVVPKGVLVGSGADEHAVEAAVARLRSKLGPLGPGIRTVRRRGYACEFEVC